MREIKLKSAVMTRIGRHDEDYTALLAQAVARALDHVDPGQLDSVYLSSFAPRELCGIDDARAPVRDALRRSGVTTDPEVHGPFRTGGEALYQAIERCHATDRDVLVVGCEKMMHIDAATASGLLAPRVSDAVESAHGATLPALAALAVRAYADAFRVPASAFDQVAVKNHTHASMNPDAQFRTVITADQVRASPVVADPLRRLHCAPVSDGAAACVLTGGTAPPHALRLTGWGRGRDAARFHDRAHPGTFVAATAAARDAFARAGRSPRDVDVVEIHDAFAPFELMNLEAMGFFDAGDAWRALARGELSPGGRIAVNPSGGMKARGHPIGVCGLTSMAEVVAQLRGAAGARQHPRARIATVQSAGGVAPDTYVFIVEAP
ncbi:MAG TPA: thiolase family protein [Candidatus Krumholzibacteria bacterium]